MKDQRGDHRGRHSADIAPLPLHTEVDTEDKLHVILLSSFYVSNSLLISF